jgi:hypothetical protein
MPPLANAAGAEPFRQKVVAETILGKVDAALD